MKYDYEEIKYYLPNHTQFWHTYFVFGNKRLVNPLYTLTFPKCLLWTDSWNQRNRLSILKVDYNAIVLTKGVSR